MTEEHTINCPCTEYKRKVWYLPSAIDSPERIGLFLDGEFYLSRMDAPAVIRQLEASGQIPPTVCVFISHLDNAARHRDFTCNPSYTNFLIREVLAWVYARNPELPKGGHLISGISLSGLAAAYIALSHLDIFSQCLAHSGSFWWNQEWLAAHLPGSVSHGQKWWLSVGNQETETGVSYAPSGMLQEVAQVPACERFAQALHDQGHEVQFHLYEGGHSFEPWKAELAEALIWLSR